MAKKSKAKHGIKVPKKIFGMKVSKRRRKDLQSLVGLFDTPEAKALIGSTAAGLVAMWANRQDHKEARTARTH